MSQALLPGADANARGMNRSYRRLWAWKKTRLGTGSLARTLHLQQSPCGQWPFVHF